jgi:UDP-4-amino-4,6-dideoxy-N-acetyl-beta-L-altrosamine N-acetyltransferase
MIPGKKIKLRALVKEDIERLRNWRNMPELFRYHFSPLPLSQMEQEHWYEGYVSGGRQTVFIVENDKDLPIGYTLIKDLDHKNQCAEIGLYLSPEFQEQGYGKDAFRTLMKFCFYQLNLHRLMLEVFAFNERAVQLYEKLGFKQEGILRDAYFCDNQFHDIIMMSILKDEFVDSL